MRYTPIEFKEADLKGKTVLEVDNKMFYSETTGRVVVGYKDQKITYENAYWLPAGFDRIYLDETSAKEFMIGI